MSAGPGSATDVMAGEREPSTACTLPAATEASFSINSARCAAILKRLGTKANAPEA